MDADTDLNRDWNYCNIVFNVGGKGKNNEKSDMTLSGSVTTYLY